MLDNWIDPIKDNVAFSNAYINWEDFKTKLKEGDETAWLEFDKITSEVAREYGRDVEKEYSCEVEISNLEDEIESLEDEISDLEDDIRSLEEQLETCGERIVYLEELLDDNEINYAG